MKPKQKAAARSLATIVCEIRKTLKDDIGNIIRRGELLQEAKVQLEHGQWLPWLEDNFAMKERTAQRAMAVAHFAAKYVTLTDLQLTKSALYELSSGEYSEKVIKAVLKEAESKLVNEYRIYAIDDELNPPPPPEQRRLSPEAEAEQQRLQAEWEQRRQAEAEAEKILDGPPPELPPQAGPPPPVDFVLAQFNGAIKVLRELRTKSVNKFAGTTYTGDQLKEVADFLCAVAQER